MNGSHPRAGRHITVGLAVLAFVTAACSGGGVEEGNQEPSVAVTPEPDPSAEAEAEIQEIEAVFDAYWSAVVQAQSGEVDDPAELFEGLAVDDVIEENVGVAVRYADQGIARVGSPAITDVEVEVDGDSARVSACVDESQWLAELADGKTLPPQEAQLKPRPVVFEVLDSNGSWLIGRSLEPEGNITC